MLTLETDCRHCSHERVCVKKLDYNSYICEIKQTERSIPDSVKVTISCGDFSESVATPRSESSLSGLCCAPGWGDDRPSVEYSTGV